MYVRCFGETSKGQKTTSKRLFFRNHTFQHSNNASVIRISALPNDCHLFKRKTTRVLFLLTTTQHKKTRISELFRSELMIITACSKLAAHHAPMHLMQARRTIPPKTSHLVHFIAGLVIFFCSRSVLLPSTAVCPRSAEIGCCSVLPGAGCRYRSIRSPASVDTIGSHPPVRVALRLAR